MRSTTPTGRSSPGAWIGTAAQLHGCHADTKCSEANTSTGLPSTSAVPGPFVPADLLRPERPGAEVDLRDLLDHVTVPVDGEHPALTVQVGEDGIVQPEAAREVGDDGTREAEHVVALASRRECLRREDDARARHARIDPVEVAGSPP